MMKIKVESAFERKKYYSIQIYENNQTIAN